MLGAVGRNLGDRICALKRPIQLAKLLNQFCVRKVFKDACLPIQETMPLQSRLNRAPFYLAPLSHILFVVVQHPVPMFAASSVAWNGQLMIIELTTCLAIVALVYWTQPFVLVAAWNAKAEKLVAILQSIKQEGESLKQPGAN